MSVGIAYMYVTLHNDRLKSLLVFTLASLGFRYCLRFTDEEKVLKESIHKGQLGPTGTHVPRLFL